jgi:isoquinoline 1-oxidoreductase alpha subunit
MELTINGTTYRVEAEADMPLLWMIRDELGMTGPNVARLRRIA